MRTARKGIDGFLFVLKTIPLKGIAQLSNYNYWTVTSVHSSVCGGQAYALLYRCVECRR